MDDLTAARTREWPSASSQQRDHYSRVRCRRRHRRRAPGMISGERGWRGGGWLVFLLCLVVGVRDLTRGASGFKRAGRMKAEGRA